MGKITAKIFVSFLFVWGCQGRSDRILTAKEAVNVYASQDAAMDVTAIEIMTLGIGETAIILECVDVKHYYIYRVKLPNGRAGFINQGKYTVSRDGVPDYCR